MSRPAVVSALPEKPFIILRRARPIILHLSFDKLPAVHVREANSILAQVHSRFPPIRFQHSFKIYRFIYLITSYVLQSTGIQPGTLLSPPYIEAEKEIHQPWHPPPKSKPI